MYKEFRCPNCNELWQEEDVQEGTVRKLCGRCKWLFTFKWENGVRVILDKVPKSIATMAR